MKDVECYNPGLAQSIQDEYYRLYPFLCSALKNYMTFCVAKWDEWTDILDKDYFVQFAITIHQDAVGKVEVEPSKTSWTKNGSNSSSSSSPAKEGTGKIV